MIFFRIRLLLLIISLTCISCTEGEKTFTSTSNQEDFFNSRFPYNNDFGLQELPILAWYSLRGEMTTKENYMDLKNAGFTHNLSFHAGEEDLKRSLEFSKQAGIKTFLHVCPIYCSESEMKRLVAKYKDHPALAGYFVYDEPRQDMFQTLTTWIDTIQKIDSNLIHPCYINLFPGYGDPDHVYTNYISDFINSIPNAPIISFDHYPICQFNNSPDLVLRKWWYRDLEVISRAAKKSNKPFWAFALSTAMIPFDSEEDYIQPIPTLSNLRLQVYSNLAYGAKGIQYFSYLTPNAPGYHDGPLDPFGNKTQTYETVKAMNMELKKISWLFFNSRVIKTLHTGDNIPLGTKRLYNWHLPKAFDNLATSNHGAVVSFLRANASFSNSVSPKPIKEYMVIVNRDPNNSISLGFCLNPDPKYKVYRLNKEDGSTWHEIAKYNMPTKCYSTNIAPGDIAIFSYTPGWKNDSHIIHANN